MPAIDTQEDDRTHASDTVIQTYVWHGDKCFFVSTIERASSAAAAYGMRYNETIVWAWDTAKKERGAQLHMTDDQRGSIVAHQRTVEAIHDVGEKAFL